LLEKLVFLLTYIVENTSNYGLPYHYTLLLIYKYNKPFEANAFTISSEANIALYISNNIKTLPELKLPEVLKKESQRQVDG